MFSIKKIVSHFFGIRPVRSQNNNKRLGTIYKIFGIVFYKRKEKFKKSTEKPAFYLKVNRKSDYLLFCVQQWLNICFSSGNDVYLLCDDPQLKYTILSSCAFGNSNFKFIRSKRRHFSKTALVLGNNRWKKCTCAQLTTFYHSQKNNYKAAWNIDADDTSFALSTKRIVQALIAIEKQAIDNAIDVYSLDMHTTKLHGLHWSFGITFFQNRIQWDQFLAQSRFEGWQNSYVNKPGFVKNADWFFTYLRDTDHALLIKTFYLENCRFIHWGSNFISQSPFCWLNFWKDGFLYYPLLQNGFLSTDFGKLPIKRCEKIDLQITDEEAKEYFDSQFLQAQHKYLKQMGNQK